MQRKTSSPERTRTALVSFLHAHLGTIEGGDVGPWIGQAALLRERGAASMVSTAGMLAGVNAALAGDAAGPWRKARARRVPSKAPRR